MNLGYGCGTWSLTLREERKLNVFENKMARNICESKRDEITGEWGRPHNEKLNEFYSLPNILVIKFRRLRWAWHLAHTGRGLVYTGF